MSASSDIATVDNNDCTVVRFSTADYAPHKRLDACREIYGRTLSKRDIEPLSAEQFHTEATLRSMPGLGIVTARRSAAICRFSRKFINNDDVFATIRLTPSYEVASVRSSAQFKAGEGIVLTGRNPDS